MPSVQSAPVTARSRYLMASRVVRTWAGGVVSSGSSSLLTIPPVRAYGQGAKLCATKRFTPHGAPGGEQVIRALGPQPVRGGEVALHAARVERPDGGQLVDDHVGLSLRDRASDRLWVECVRDHRACAQLAKEILLGLAPHHARDLVPVLHELGHQRPPERAGCARNEDFHDGSFLVCSPLWTRQAGAL